MFPTVQSDPVPVVTPVLPQAACASTIVEECGRQRTNLYRDLPIKWLTFVANGTGFAGPIVLRVKVTDISILRSTTSTIEVGGKGDLGG